MTRLLQLLIHRSARFRALMHKELLTTLKDRTSRMILVGPLVLYVILFGYVATFNLDYAPYALLDMSKTRQSAKLIRAVDESAVFDRVMTLQNTAQIAPAIDSGKALVVLVIGQDYAEKLSEGKVAQVQVIIDGRNSTTAQLAAGYLSIIAGNVSGAGTVFESIRYLYNPNNLTQWFILPALIMMLSMLQIMVLSALSVAREREMGTFEQLLVTPFTTGELLASKAVVPILIGIFQGTLIFLISVFWFQVPLMGSILKIYAVMAVFVLSIVGLGLAISYNMAKLLNGTLKVENTPDGWVLFTLSLPPLEVTTGVSSSKRITSEYIPKIESQLVLKLPHYEFDKMRPTLLVIDDELEMLWFIGEIFSNDFNVVTLQEPERVEQVLNEVYPNVIICDIMMPGVGGIELTKRIKSVKETSHIPIIMVSGRHEMEQQMAALSAGAEMYITKPFNAEYLRISVCQMLERKEVLKDYFSSAISSFEKTDGKLTHKESKKFQQSVLKIINDHIQEKELTPRFIADHLAISVRSLYRKMEEMGEESPTIMIKECRLYVAKDLLLKTKKTIDEIVFEAGFSNKVTFFKVFREKYGCTPKEFRTKHLEEVQ